MPGPWDKQKVTMDGRTGYLSRGMIQALDCLAKAQGWGGHQALTIYQFGWRPRTSFSGTTHVENAADLSANQWQVKVKDGRKLGIWIAHRTAAQGNWDPHCHAGMVGGGNQSDAMDGQIVEYLHGGDGLLGNRKDPDWRPLHPEVQFVPDAKVGKWTVTTRTQGRSEAGTEAKLAKAGTLRDPGYVIVNMGTVKIGSMEYLVTENMTFYEKAHVKVWSADDAEDPGTPDPTPTPVPVPPPVVQTLAVDHATANVNAGFDNLPKRYTTRVPAIAKLLNTAATSMRITQEADTSADATLLCNAMGDQWRYTREQGRDSRLSSTIDYDSAKHRMLDSGRFDVSASTHDNVTWALYENILTGVIWFEWSTLLWPFPIGPNNTASDDKIRRDAIDSACRQARAYTAQAEKTHLKKHIPIIGGGDLNHDKNDLPDAPGDAAKKWDLVDAQLVAQTKVHGTASTHATAGGLKPGGQIDRFLVDERGVTVHRYEVINAYPHMDHNIVVIATTVSNE
jgi:hypothetical protein